MRRRIARPLRALGRYRYAAAMACVLTQGVAVVSARAQGADRDSLSGNKRTRPVWRVGVEAGSSREQDVRFIGDGESDTYHRVGGVVSGGAASARWRAELEARGDVVRFAALRDLDRETWDIGSTLSWRATPRVQAQAAVRALTSTMPSGIAQLDPTVLPLLITRTQSGVVSLASRVLRSSELVLALDGTRIRFDAPGFVGGYTGGAALRATTRTATARTIGAQLDVRRARFDSLGVTTALFEGDVTRELGRASLRLRAGVTGTINDAAGGGTTSAQPTGSIELSQRLRRVTVRALAGRSVLPAFGFGRVFRTDVASLSAEYAQLRGVSVRMSADASHNVDPSGPDLSLTFTSLTGEVSRPVGSRLAVVVGAFTRQRLQGDAFANRGVTLSARFDTSR
jgi:hypothetical protein